MSNALTGMGISIAVAFAVLVLSTMNILVGSYATITIAGIVASVLATMQLLEWELGVTESVSSVILIGFSVDYVSELRCCCCSDDETPRY